MPAYPTIREILAQATRYVILKSDQGVTVGLHVNDKHYGEGHSAAGDLDEAIRLAYEQAMKTKGRNKRRH
jgi:hypothetical protein